MRRWSALLTTFSLLAVAAAGCHHTAGVCDCDPWHDHHPIAEYTHGVDHSYAVGPHAAAPGMPVPGNGFVSAPVSVAPPPRPMPSQPMMRAEE
jgi:hypothetical protein